MPEYIVKTFDDRSLVIEADNFSFNPDGVYEFHKNQGLMLVGSVPASNIFAVVENDAYQADFYRSDLDDDPDEDNDETDDTCLHCQFVEFTESQEFFDAVADVVEILSEPDEPEVDQPQGQEIPRLYLARNEKYYDGTQWGFAYEDKFVPFGDSKSDAEGGLKRHINGERDWYTWPLSEVTEVVQ